MAETEFELFPKRRVNKYLTVILDEDEEIIGCLKEALKNNELEECTIVGCEGVVKHGVINYFHKHVYKSKTVKDATVINGSGRFVRGARDYEGNLHLMLPLDGEKVNGTLVKGKAENDFKINLRFSKIEG